MQSMAFIIRVTALTMDVTDSAREWLANTGYDPAYGARPLRRLVQTEVGDQLARMLLAGKVHDGDTVLVDQTGGEHLELSAWASDQIASDDPDVSVDNVSEDKNMIDAAASGCLTLEKLEAMTCVATLIYMVF